MDSRTMHPGKYLKASDFEQAQMWTIADLREEQIQNQQTGRTENKWILYFTEDDRGLVLNVTNRIALEEFLGFETDEWVEHKVVLFKDRVSFGGKMVDAIRLREPRKAARPQPTRPTKPMPVKQPEPELVEADELNPPADIDDEIPF
jgi:hypothetical protein